MISNNSYKFAPNPATGFLDTDSAKKYFSRFGFSIFALGMISSVMGYLLVLAVRYLIDLYFPWVFDEPAIVAVLNELIGFLPLYLVALPVFLKLISPLPGLRPVKESMSFGKFISCICVAVLFMTVGNYISSVVISALSNMKGGSIPNDLGNRISTSPVWVTLIFTVILAPILEELVFRKLVCDRLLPLGEGIAVVISSVTFGLFHGNFRQFAYAFLTGLILSFIYVKTGKLIYSTAIHVLINLFGSVVGPWIVGKIDIEHLNEIIAAGAIDPSDPMILPIFFLGLYELFIFAVSIAGCVIFSRAGKRGELKLDSGILPLAREGRVSAILLNAGAAAAITYFVLEFIRSLF